MSYYVLLETLRYDYGLSYREARSLARRARITGITPGPVSVRYHGRNNYSVVVEETGQ